MTLLSAKPMTPISACRQRFIAWSHWACTSAAWQDYFRGEDDDPRPSLD